MTKCWSKLITDTDFGFVFLNIKTKRIEISQVLSCVFGTVLIYVAENRTYESTNYFDVAVFKVILMTNSDTYKRGHDIPIFYFSFCREDF